MNNMRWDQQVVTRQTEHGVMMARYRRAQAAEAAAEDAVQAAHDAYIASLERQTALHNAAVESAAASGGGWHANLVRGSAMRKSAEVEQLKAAKEAAEAVKAEKIRGTNRAGYAAWQRDAGQATGQRYYMKGR